MIIYRYACIDLTIENICKCNFLENTNKTYRRFDMQEIKKNELHVLHFLTFVNQNVLLW